ncbi:MAG: outer membrane protein assembly factor BamD [Proteobacteria bacterium]|nr:outer membrane protein assembly factor BamD [Pseudomonadota bacterium]
MPFRILFRAALPALLALALLSACADSSDNKPYVERPVDDLYNGALKSMKEKDYPEAARQFDEVERQHPYSEWASRAQLMAAYANYQAYKYAEAIGTLDRFIELHPGHNDIAYAYYLRALCHYEQISDVGRDQSDTSKAMQDLQDVTKRFPGTAYARDAALKISLTRDHLAGKELEIGRYYQRQKLYIAALGRFRKVVTDFQTTSQVAEAMARLVEVYLALGIPREAQAVAAVLGYNFPSSPWYKESYALLTKQNLAPQTDDGSWISKVFKG